MVYKFELKIQYASNRPQAIMAIHMIMEITADILVKKEALRSILRL